MSHNLLLNTEIDILVLLLVACLAAIALQKRILDRVALVVQNNTIKELAERGEVTETAASQIRELINVNSG